MQESTWREATGKAVEQRLGKLALFRRQRRVVPFGAVHVVDRHEGRLAALREADVVGGEVGVDAATQHIDRSPLRIGVRLGHARIFVHARDAHRVREVDAARIGESDHRRGIARIRRAGERQMTFAREETGRRVEPDPSRTGQVDLGPGMEVGEIVVGARGAVERLHVGDELDQITGGEARGEAQMPEDLHHEPARVSARSASELQRLVGRVHARFHPHQVLDFVLQRLIQPHEHVDGLVVRLHRRAKALDPGGEPRPGRSRLEERNQLLRERWRVLEWIVLGVGFDEEIERVDHRHVGGQVDDDVELVGGLGEHEPRDPVAVRILLPVEEILVRRDVQRIAEDGRPAMRCRAQPDFVRRQIDVPVEAIRRPVLKCDANGHGLVRLAVQFQSGLGSCANTRRRPSPHSEWTIR